MSRRFLILQARKCEARLGVGGNSPHPGSRALAVRRVTGDRYDPGVQATEKRLHELQARRVEEQGAMAGGSVRLETCGNGAGSPVQLGISDLDDSILAVEQERISSRVGLLLRP